MTRPDTWIGLFLVGAALAALAEAWTFPSVVGMRFGAWTFPVAVSAGLGICGAILFAQSILRRPSDADVSATGILPDSPVRAAIGFLLVVTAPAFYIAAAEKIGFLLSAGIIVFTLSWWFWRGPLRCALLAMLVAAGAELIFAEGLSVPIPEGWASLTELL